MPGISHISLPSDVTSLPSEWHAVGKVSKLYVYPVKSLAPVSVDRLMCIATGGLGSLDGSAEMADRQFIIFNNKTKNMATGRRYPVMTRIKARLDNCEGGSQQKLTLHYPGFEDLVATIPEQKQEDVEVSVFGEQVFGERIGGDMASLWLGSVIKNEKDNKDLHLLMHRKGESSRVQKTLDANFRPLEKTNDVPYYADGYPYLLLSDQSVQELNRRLKQDGQSLQVEETRFRPNIFVTGDFGAFSEDKWSYIRIGGAEETSTGALLRNVKPCGRCVFTTVDPLTGTKGDGGIQPLKLLKEFRTVESDEEKSEYKTSPLFGINLGVETPGDIKVGDTVWVRTTEA